MKQVGSIIFLKLICKQLHGESMAFQGTVGPLPDMPVMSFKKPSGKFIAEIIDGSKYDFAVSPLISKHPELTQARDLDQRVIIHRVGMKPDICGT
jgi:hypothetical protein